jgi:hypothetical protein
MSSRGAREGPEAGAETDVDPGFGLREGTGRAADPVGFGGVFRAAHPPASATTAANPSVKRVTTRWDFALTDPGQLSMSLGYPKSLIVSTGWSWRRGAGWSRRWESNPRQTGEFPGELHGFVRVLSAFREGQRGSRPSLGHLRLEKGGPRPEILALICVVRWHGPLSPPSAFRGRDPDFAQAAAKNFRTQPSVSFRPSR